MLYSPREAGQGLMEYALILSLAVLVVVIVVAILGGAVENLYQIGITSLLDAFG